MGCGTSMVAVSPLQTLITLLIYLPAGRILPDLLPSMPHDLPPFENLSVSRHANLPTEHAYINGITGEKLGGKVWQDSEGNNTAVRANRIAFRKWLAMNLDIVWNKVFSHYEEGDGYVTAYFKDGTSYVGDVLVGADGMNSKGTFDACNFFGVITS